MNNLQGQFEKETGKSAEAPTYLDEPRYFNPLYVEWLERRLTPISPSPKMTMDEFQKILVKPQSECDGAELHLRYLWNNKKADSIFFITGLDFSLMFNSSESKQVTDEEIVQVIRNHFHGFSDEQWEELKTTFPYAEIPFIVRDILTKGKEEK